MFSGGGGVVGDVVVEPDVVPLVVEGGALHGRGRLATFLRLAAGENHGRNQQCLRLRLQVLLLGSRSRGKLYSAFLHELVGRDLIPISVLCEILGTPVPVGPNLPDDP